MSGACRNGSSATAAVLGGIVAFASTVVVAEGTTPSLAGPAAAQGLAMLKLLAALGVVLLAFWICARVFARFGRDRAAGSAGLDILGSVSLGQRERLVMVRAGNTRLVVGVTAHAITPVHVFGPDDEDDATVASPMTGAAVAPRSSVSGAVLQGLPSGPDFAARLRTALGRTSA